MYVLHTEARALECTTEAIHKHAGNSLCHELSTSRGKGGARERGLAHEAPFPLVNSAMPSTVWLGLSRAGSMLSSAWDGVSELFNPIVDAMFKVSFGVYDCNNFNCIFNSVNYTVIVMYNLTDRIII